MRVAARITLATVSIASVSVYINNFGEYHHPYEKLRKISHRFFGYLRREIENLDQVKRRRRNGENVMEIPMGMKNALFLK